MRQDTRVTPLYIASKPRNYLGNNSLSPTNINRSYSSPASIPYNRPYNEKFMPKPVVRAKSDNYIPYCRGF